MFSSDNNSYPLFYQQSPSLSNDAIPESNNILFQHYNGKLLPPLFPATSDNSLVKLSSEPLINQQSNILCPSNVVIDNVSSSRRPPCKKDRHTKISTAQGVRDRRVRLSMNIAREFFNLQDMLGFDKASKTLGWLLNKSKAAIDELATARSLKMKTPSEDTHVKDQDDDHGDEEKKALGGKSSSKKRKKRENNLNSRNVAKEMRRREEARQRARERTRKKKIVDDHHNNQQQLESLNHHQPLYHHQRVLQDLVFCQSNSATTPNNNSPPNALISKAGSTVRETVVIKSNSKSRGSSYNYNYETMITSKDAKESCNFNYGDFCNNKSASESCNYGGMIIQPPGLSALNIINLSTEIHIDARPWDAYDNQLLH